MRSLLKRYSARREYRFVSSLLIAALVLTLLSAALIPDETAYWDYRGLLAFALGLPCYIGLVALTYYRLQRAAVSSAWLFLTVFVFHVGPTWEWAGPLSFHPSGLVSLVPVIIGWIARDRDEPAPVEASKTN